MSIIEELDREMITDLHKAANPVYEWLAEINRKHPPFDPTTWIPPTFLKEMNDMNDHIVVDAKDQTIKCLHCLASDPLPLPMEIGKLVKFTEKWAGPHKACKKPTTTDYPPPIGGLRRT